MTYFFGITHKFVSFIQSGMYIDYIVKKISEIFVKNFLIYSSTFFGEKFIIEFLTRKFLDHFTTNFSLWITNKSYETSALYHTIVCGILILILVLEFLFLFLI